MYRQIVTQVDEVKPEGLGARLSRSIGDRLRAGRGKLLTPVAHPYVQLPMPRRIASLRVNDEACGAEPSIDVQDVAADKAGFW